MSVRYKFKQAKRLISCLSPDDLMQVKKICIDIHQKEKELCEAARKNLNRCYHSCEGLCCRNIQIDTILSHWDFLYLLMLTDTMDQQIINCLENENLFFSADCIFLENGVGPCIFPDGIRPEICIVSFCTQTESIDPEVKRVKNRFFKLTWAVNYFRIRSAIRKIFGFKS